MRGKWMKATFRLKFLRRQFAVIMLTLGLATTVMGDLDLSAEHKQEDSKKSYTPGSHRTAGESKSQSSKTDPAAALSDHTLIDQDGKKVRYYADLIKGKLVVISYFYTSCRFLCSIQGTLFSELQNLLGERLGKEVFLLSITMDPETDTPERLKAWSKEYGVRPGWTLLTGELSEMGNFLKSATGNPAGRPEMHSISIIIWDDQTRIWKTASGVSDPQNLMKIIEEVSKNRVNRPGGKSYRMNL